MNSPHDARVALVAHEEAMCRCLLKRILERSGFQVRLAISAEQARELLQEHPADQALLGIASVSRTGMEILRQEKHSPRPGSTRWVVVADESQLSEWETARSLGAQDLITRPFSSTHLLERIHEWMQAANEGAVMGAQEAPLARASTVEE